jgi:CRP/FNR family transcriptional regulator, anaerobic regulatory protein
MDELTQLLQRISPQKKSDKNLVENFAELFKRETLLKEYYFLQKDQPIKKIGLVTKGVMRIFTINSCGDETNISLIAEGDLVSGSFVPELSSDVFIQCITDVEMAIADFDSVLDFFNSHNMLKEYFVNHLAKSHHVIQQRLTSYIRMNAKERYLSFLKEFPGLINRIPHYHIANYLGITTTQLSRIRNKLIKEQAS